MSAQNARTGRLRKATALVPLALLSAAFTASIAGANAPAVVASGTHAADQTLPDGTAVPTKAIEAPASVSNGGGLGLDGANATQVVSTASTSGIPSAALSAYQRAETVINAADRSCNLTWQLIAAIGRVESNHGRANGNVLDNTGLAVPGIYGIPLNGSNQTTEILDTDAGQYDNDATYDRAVGPMQFIPSTWSVVGVDADGDGQRNPQDVDDSALATAVYLCSGDDDLATTAGQRASVLRYNHSQSYVDLVLSVMNAYLQGEFTSIPNGVTSAGYVVPQLPSLPAHGPAKGHGKGGKGNHPSGGGAPGGSAPTAQPTQQPSQPGIPSAPTVGPNPPTLTLPPLPSTAVTPVDQLLTAVQARAQCLLDGFDPLLEADAFNACVYAYTH